MSNNKVLVLSSPGGHWVQLCRLLPAFGNCDVVYACTYSRPAELSEHDLYYVIGDINRDNLSRVRKVVAGIFGVIKHERPTHLVTTGALPGLIAIIIARLFGVKTIWLDSIANSEKISASGRVAAYIAHECFTQWVELSNARYSYIGRVV